MVTSPRPSLGHFLRSWLFDDPRNARSFVTGAADVQPWDQVWGIGGTDPETLRPVDFAGYLSRSNAVYACINARTKALSSLPIRLYSKRQGKDGKRTEITSGPARGLMDSINPYWTFERWLDMTEQALCIWGESFSFYEMKGGKPAEMWWARADKVKVHPHPREYISHFTYDPGDGKVIRFECEETLWLRYPNVANQYAGLSPLSAARLPADAAQAAMRSNLAIFDNGLTAAGMVSPSGNTNLTKEQSEAVANDLSRRFKGVKNAHKVAVLRFGVDIKQLSMTPKDAQFEGMMKLSLEDIARAYAVPLDKLGGQRTYANVDAAEKAFWADCIVPEAKFIASEITEQLLPLFGGDMVAEFDDSGIDVLHEAETASWERWQGQITIGARTVNEYRDEKGLDPVEWGDNWWVQTAVSPLLAVPKTTEELAIQSGRVDAGKAADTLDDELDDTGRSVRISTRSVEFGSPEHEARWQRQIAAQEPWEQRIGQATERLLRDQQQSILANLRKRGTRAVEELMLSPFDESRWIKTFRIVMRPIVAGVVAESGELARDELGLPFAFDVQNPNILRAIETQVQRFAESVNGTTWTALQASMAEGIAAGESIDQIAARIIEIMGDRIRSSGETIARTETTTASTTGTLDAWRQSGVVVGKEWLAAIDSRTRETHIAAHNQRVGIDDSFTVGGASGPGPGSLSSAKENINCRCTIVPVLDVEGL